MILRKLAFSNFSVHRVRAALTIAAVALSVSLVVSVTSGYSSAEAAAYDFLAQFIGTTDATITRRGDSGGIDESLIELGKGGACLLTLDGRPRKGCARLRWLLTARQLRDIGG